MSSGTVQGRSRRRDRYIRIACDNCRQRKTRCSGSCPCGRCTSLNLTCAYHEGLRNNEFLDQASTNPRGMHSIVSSLETQIRSIQKRLDGGSLGDLNHAQRDPLILLSAEGITRLIDLYYEQICCMYPVVEKELLVAKAKSLRSARRPAPAISRDADEPSMKNVRDVDSIILYAVLAHALYLGDQQNPVVSALLFERVEQAIGEMLSQADAQLKTIIVLVVSSLYYLHRQQDLRAWRMIRFAVEQALELELHTQKGLDRCGNLFNRTWALRVFWIVYVLDLRHSFGNSLPATLEDTDIDSCIPEPGLEYPYLNAMVTYSRIAWKIKRWTGKPGFQRGKNLTKENGFLDFQIMSWYSQLPPQIQFDVPSSGKIQDTNAGPFPLQLRVSLYLRRNQMRILLHKPYLQSVAVLQQNMEQAETAVRLAKETVESLVYIGKASSTFNAHPAVLSYFLISALTVFFPAVVHGPSDIIPLCRSGVVTAMELVKAFPETYACERLQRFVQDTRDFLNYSEHTPLPILSPQGARRFSGAGVESPRSDAKDSDMNPSSLAERVYNLLEVAVSHSTLRSCLQGNTGLMTGQDISNMSSMEFNPGSDFGEDIEGAIVNHYCYDNFLGMFDGIE